MKNISVVRLDMSVLKLMLTVAVFNSALGWATAIECYVCRGCATVGPDDIQTCDSEITTEGPEEPVTDSDTVYTNRDTVQVADVPWLEEAEAKFDDDKENGYVLVNSQLPGAERFSSRSLKQSAGDDSRCVLALFEENGATNVVRSCSTASTDDNLRCAQAIGNNFNASDVQYCRLCDQDLCNSASKTAMGVAVMTIVVSLSYIML